MAGRVLLAVSGVALSHGGEWTKEDVAEREAPTKAFSSKSSNRNATKTSLKEVGLARV